MTAEARRRDGDGAVGCCATSSGLCGTVLTAQVSRGVSQRQEGVLEGVGTPGSWKRRMDPDVEYRRFGPGERARDLGTRLEGSPESAGWGLSDQGEVLRVRADVQELISHITLLSGMGNDNPKTGLGEVVQ